MQSPRAGLPAGPIIQGLPSPPALHHSASHSKQPALRLGSSSSVHTPPPYDTPGTIIPGTHAVYSPTGIQSSPLLPPSSRTSLDHHRHQISPTCEGGVLNTLVSGHGPVTSTTTRGSSSEGASAVTSPRENQPSTATQGELVHSVVLTIDVGPVATYVVVNIYYWCRQVR